MECFGDSPPHHLLRMNNGTWYGIQLFIQMTLRTLKNGWFGESDSNTTCAVTSARSRFLKKWGNLLSHTRPFKQIGVKKKWYESDCDLWAPQRWDVHSDSCASSRMTSRESCPLRSKLHWTWKCLFSESNNDAWWQSVRYFCGLQPGQGCKTCWRHAVDTRKLREQN